MRRFVFILLLLIGYFVGLGQEESKVLTYEDYMIIVKSNHPMMINADQRLKVAEGNLIEAKGEFDPQIKGSIDQKEYERTKYYQLSEAGLVVPTWVGANLKVGYYQSIGDYVNAMDKTPANGLLSAGIELPVGQGLFYDKRRSYVDKAKIYREMADSERQLAINELIYESSLDYWNWYETYHKRVAIDELLVKSKMRLDNIIKSAELGDKAFIDTLEASIQYQNFQSLHIDAQTAEKNARALLNVHLWADGLLPLEIDTIVVPESISETILDLSVWQIQNDSLISKHPKMMVANAKIDLKDVELRLARENLKPKINVNYNMLNEPVGGDLTGFNPMDYKFGINVAIPIFLRSSRGAVQKYNAELLMAESEMKFTEQQLRTKLEMTVNKSKNSIEQAILLSDLVDKYRKLVAAERKLYNVGESSLMMLNYREIALLETELKWIEKLSKSKLAELEIRYAIGQLN